MYSYSKLSFPFSNSPVQFSVRHSSTGLNEIVLLCPAPHVDAVHRCCLKLRAGNQHPGESSTSSRCKYSGLPCKMQKAPVVAVSASNPKTNSAVPVAKAEATTTVGACGGNGAGSSRMVGTTFLATPLLTAAAILHFQLRVSTPLYKYIC